eukprot:4549493-Prymnesium_polylepis.2
MKNWRLWMAWVTRRKMNGTCLRCRDRLARTRDGNHWGTVPACRDEVEPLSPQTVMSTIQTAGNVGAEAQQHVEDPVVTKVGKRRNKQGRAASATRSDAYRREEARGERTERATSNQATATASVSCLTAEWCEGKLPRGLVIRTSRAEGGERDQTEQIRRGDRGRVHCSPTRAPTQTEHSTGTTANAAQSVHQIALKRTPISPLTPTRLMRASRQRMGPAIGLVLFLLVRR